VGEGPDGRAPPVSLRCKKKRERGRCWAGGVAELGQLGRRAREERKRKGLWPGCLRAEVGPAGEMRERERGRKGIPFSFLKFLFKFIFQTFKLQSNKNPCIRIMMHKHLLFLNYFSDVQIF
jgi:hypothetical protein